MDTRHLIDGIVRQTTVLIAQLSTVAGIRAPLARIADHVFLNLARELEAQGVGRKVAADMFGLALRSYQVKIGRLTQSASETERTLWEAVFDFLRTTRGATRHALMAKFTRDDPADVGAVLKDLVDGGLVSRAGRGERAFYQIASDEALAAVAQQQDLDAITNLVWLAAYDRQESNRSELVRTMPFDPAVTERIIDTLIAEGQIERRPAEGGDQLVCRRLAIPVGSEQGWEAAVFDHFRAVAGAIAAKLQLGGPKSSGDDVVGGTTLTFSIRAGHPFEREVLGLLARMRMELHELWTRVSEHNRTDPIDPAERTEVTFYFGQTVVAPEPRGEAPRTLRDRDS